MATKRFIIKGLVQGIGFRPYVAELADKYNIDGFVRNSGGIVTVVARAKRDVLESFVEDIQAQVPTGGFISSIKVSDCGLDVEHGFVIVESNEDEEENLPLIPADIATCDRCQQELMDPNNRRYGHPFISCTICGPRYSILKRLPYDRETITMGDFDMCPVCYGEYTGKGNIRRHAQTIACKNCGPELVIKDGRSGEKIGNSLDSIAEDCHKDTNWIMAIKDIGGYHLACSPFDEKTVASLRVLKHREAKAFAVMFKDIDQVLEYCHINDEEKALLMSPARPIVLLTKRADGKKLAPNVCLTSPSIGAMLPGNPLQILLINEYGPLIMTSANASGDVLETDDDAMSEWLMDRGKDVNLSKVRLIQIGHNRKILRPLDDAVTKVVAGRTQFIRRARGYVPTPIPVDIKGEIFAAGGDLKSSFCYVKNGLAYMSQHLGDLESMSCQKFYKSELKAMAEIFGFKPDLMVCDKHPGYYSRQIARQEFDNLHTIEIQHHKAHVAAVIAEYNLVGPLLGFAFDGTGFGEDGAIWGSEVFRFDGSNMERVGHLPETILIGGDEGAKNCDTILAGFLHKAVIESKFSEQVLQEKCDSISLKALELKINTIKSTSMGRLFDAMSALLDICHYNSYEGQAAIELENVASTTNEWTSFDVIRDNIIDTSSLFSQAIVYKNEGIEISKIARGFIYAIADFILAQAKANNIKQVVLSGGTFLNRILVERALDLLESEDFEVYTSKLLPPGDGSIALGQAFLAYKNNLKN